MHTQRATDTLAACARFTAECHAQTRVFTQRAAVSQEFSGDEAPRRGQDLQMHIYPGM